MVVDVSLSAPNGVSETSLITPPLKTVPGPTISCPFTSIFSPLRSVTIEAGSI